MHRNRACYVLLPGFITLQPHQSTQKKLRLQEGISDRRPNAVGAYRVPGATLSTSHAVSVSARASIWENACSRRSVNGGRYS